MSGLALILLVAVGVISANMLGWLGPAAVDINGPSAPETTANVAGPTPPVSPNPPAPLPSPTPTPPPSPTPTVFLEIAITPRPTLLAESPDYCLRESEGSLSNTILLVFGAGPFEYDTNGIYYRFKDCTPLDDDNVECTNESFEKIQDHNEVYENEWILVSIELDAYACNVKGGYVLRKLK